MYLKEKTVHYSVDYIFRVLTFRRSCVVAGENLQSWMECMSCLWDPQIQALALYGPSDTTA